MMVVRPQQIHRQRRYQGSRQDERHNHGKNDGECHGNEQEPGDAWKEEHRHKHDANAQERDKGRTYDLRRAVHNRVPHRLAVFEVPIDVLDRNRGIIDQDTNRQCQPT